MKSLSQPANRSRSYKNAQSSFTLIDLSLSPPSSQELDWAGVWNFIVSQVQVILIFKIIPMVQFSGEQLYHGVFGCFGNLDY